TASSPPTPPSLAVGATSSPTMPTSSAAETATISANATSIPASAASSPANAAGIPLTPTSIPAAPPRVSLQDAVKAAVGRHQGTIGVVVTKIDSGQSFSLNADRRFISASLYKLFVLDAAEAAIEAGTLDPSETLTVTAAMAAND